MTPKEKADELINKYLTSRDANQWDDVRDVHAAIRCALIAVDEILFALKYDMNEPTSASIRYWIEVKKEIENL
jgi:hypothetical protein